mmetsp:Transcript_159884/g.509071  ORF Transcript_159884/g.509071 Transcript_159884/m.509071 type:complete len:99 (-) Transcript_159884:233-529(-)
MCWQVRGGICLWAHNRRYSQGRHAHLRRCVMLLKGATIVGQSSFYELRTRALSRRCAGMFEVPFQRALDLPFTRIDVFWWAPGGQAPLQGDCPLHVAP